jgi:hypothetical protein
MIPPALLRVALDQDLPQEQIDLELLGVLA